MEVASTSSKGAGAAETERHKAQDSTRRLEAEVKRLSNSLADLTSTYRLVPLSVYSNIQRNILCVMTGPHLMRYHLPFSRGLKGGPCLWHTTRTMLMSSVFSFCSDCSSLAGRPVSTPVAVHQTYQYHSRDTAMLSMRTHHNSAETDVSGLSHDLRHQFTRKQFSCFGGSRHMTECS